MYASGSRKPWQQPGRAGGSLYRNTLFFGHLSSEKKQNANCGDKQGNINAFYISLCLSPRFTFCYLCTKMCRWTELAVQTLSCLPLPKFLSSPPPPPLLLPVLQTKMCLYVAPTNSLISWAPRKADWRIQPLVTKKVLFLNCNCNCKNRRRIKRFRDLKHPMVPLQPTR